MEQRRLGRTGQMSTVVAFGAAGIGRVDQETADKAIQTALDYGVNHIDVAPGYGDAELTARAVDAEDPGPGLPRLQDDRPRRRRRLGRVQPLAGAAPDRPLRPVPVALGRQAGRRWTSAPARAARWRR